MRVDLRAVRVHLLLVGPQRRAQLELLTMQTFAKNFAKKAAGPVAAAAVGVSVASARVPTVCVVNLRVMVMPVIFYRGCVRCFRLKGETGEDDQRDDST